MAHLFRKESPKFDGTNYDSQKDKMKTHLLCMDLGYWLLTKIEKMIMEEDNLENCTKEQRDFFMCNIREREALFSTLLKNEYNQVKSLKTSHEIWKAFESNYKGDTHAKRVRLQNLICAFHDAKMMKDESIRSYVATISEIVVGT